MTSSTRDEWLKLMLELAAANRDAYRAVRAHAWKLVVESHEEQTPAERSKWKQNAS